MKMTKRIAVMAVCAAMAATSMISVCVSASDVTVNEKYLISEMGQSASGIAPYADAVSLNVSKIEDKYRQGNGNWCWVACTQFVLKYLGKDCSQAEIYKSAKNTDTVEDKRGTLYNLRNWRGRKMPRNLILTEMSCFHISISR